MPKIEEDLFSGHYFVMDEGDDGTRRYLSPLYTWHTVAEIQQDKKRSRFLFDTNWMREKHFKIRKILLTGLTE
jgi:uncharacterized protein (DUF2126 family)